MAAMTTDFSALAAPDSGLWPVSLLLGLLGVHFLEGETSGAVTISPVCKGVKSSAKTALEGRGQTAPAD